MSTAKKSILLIDDEPIILVPLFHFLLRKGFDVVSTNSPVAALSLIRPDKFDVVITDFNMRPVTGAEIIGRLRESDFSGKIMLISAHRGMYADTEKNLQIDAFFGKPFDLSAVYEKIREWTE